MNKLAIAAVLALGITSSEAQDIRYQKTVQFGSQPVTIRLGTNPVFACLDLLPDESKMIYEENVAHKEYLARQYWDCGDSWQLMFLSALRELDGDLVSAYAYQYAAVQVAKVSIQFNSKEVSVRGPLHAAWNKDLVRIGNKLSASDRATAIARAAELVEHGAYILTPL